MMEVEAWKRRLSEAESLASDSNKNEAAQEILTTLIKECELELKDNEQRVDKCEVLKVLALAYNNRGHLKYLKVDFDEAVIDYTHALTADGSLALAFYNRGLIHYRLARFDDAIGDMETCLKLNPNMESASQCLAQARIDKRGQNNKGS